MGELIRYEPNRLPLNMPRIEIVLIDTFARNNEIYFKVTQDYSLYKILEWAALRAARRGFCRGVLVGDTKWSVGELKNLQPNDKLIDFGITDGYTLVTY